MTIIRETLTFAALIVGPALPMLALLLVPTRRD